MPLNAVFWSNRSSNRPYALQSNDLPRAARMIWESSRSELFPGTLPSEKPSGRMDSWKEIAAYLGRDVTTAQRWEKRERMPVHRHLHDKRGSVYALAPELDAWL